MDIKLLEVREKVVSHHIVKKHHKHISKINGKEIVFKILYHIFSSMEKGVVNYSKDLEDRNLIVFNFYNLVT